jgi:preprotein translocase subunit SecG
MATVILTIHLLLAFALIVVVLLQRSEGGGLGIGGGGGGGGVMSGRGAASALSKVTWALGVAFVCTSLTLTVIAARDSATDSVLDRIGTPVVPGDPTAPALPPGLEGDLLPPLPAAEPDAAPAEPTETGPAVPPPLEGGPAVPPAQD